MVKAALRGRRVVRRFFFDGGVFCGGVCCVDISESAFEVGIEDDSSSCCCCCCCCSAGSAGVVLGVVMEVSEMLGLRDGRRKSCGRVCG
jgi:hypothetical protein